MNILGIQAFFPDSSACLVQDGQVVSAVQEERLTRQKRTRAFPINAVEFCLSTNGLTLKDIDCIAFPVNPAMYLDVFNAAQSGALRYRGEIYASVMNNLMRLDQTACADQSSQAVMLEDGSAIKVVYVEHHLAHAAIGYYPSGYEQAAILSVDGFGEKDCVLFAKGKGNKIEPIFKQEFPHSLGCFYLTLTEFLGFTPNSDEWKVMGASSYGNPKTYYQKLISLFNYKQKGFELNLNYFNFYNFHRPFNYAPKLVELIGNPRQPGEPMTERHYDLAAAAQKVLEEVTFYLAEQLYKETGLKELCFTGGVAMNSVCNGKVLQNTSFEKIHVPFSPDDSGGSVGAALYVAHQLNNRPRYKGMANNYLGPWFTDEDIESELDKFGLTYEKKDNIAREAAQQIADGKIVGWFQGALEFGDRALGNRSILGDPRNAAMKDIINNKVKFREEFRPFAPSILSAHTDEYFEEAEPTPFMEKVYMIRKEKRDQIPAVTHVDGSGRLQTVEEKNNPLYYRLISYFKEITGIPIVLNTSFNLKGEPMVCTPKDAVRTFFTCGMDVLMMGPYVITK